MGGGVGGGMYPRGLGPLSVLASQEKHLSFNQHPTAPRTLAVPGLGGLAEGTVQVGSGPRVCDLLPPHHAAQPEQLLFLKMCVRLYYSTHTSEGSRT